VSRWTIHHEVLGAVPAGDEWLGRRERDALAALRLAPRRDDWRLGRWTAKRLLTEHLGIEPDRVEVVAANDGAPEVLLDGLPSAISLSISHRGGRAIATAIAGGETVGCDLELIEPRSDAFVSTWLTPREAAWCADGDTGLRVNLVWTAKEAASKCLREGLRLDARDLDVRDVTTADHTTRPGRACAGWQPLTVTAGGRRLRGWWTADEGAVATVVTHREVLDGSPAGCDRRDGWPSCAPRCP